MIITENIEEHRGGIEEHCGGIEEHCGGIEEHRGGRICAAPQCMGRIYAAPQ